jgi:hypothetical protein
LARLEPDEQHAVTIAMDVQGNPPPYQIRTVTGLIDLTGLEVGGFLSYTQAQLPISRRYEYVDDSGALVQTAEVKVVYQGAELVFGLNATPDKTRHSVTVRRGQDSGPGRDPHSDERRVSRRRRRGSRNAGPPHHLSVDARQSALCVRACACVRTPRAYWGLAGVLRLSPQPQPQPWPLQGMQPAADRGVDVQPAADRGVDAPNPTN